MKYAILPEFKIYSVIHMPMQKTFLKIANNFMPYVQPGKKMYPGKLARKTIHFSRFTSDFITPKGTVTDSVMLYCHGGAFAIKAAQYHKDLVQEYAIKANLSVLMPDYDLAPFHPFPTPLTECFEAYKYLLKYFPSKKIIVAGDSAGGSLAASVILLAKKRGIRTPDGLMLVYPVLDPEMKTKSMKMYTDTPVWNSILNEKMWSFYTNDKTRKMALLSPLKVKDLSYFPKTYVETTQYDCLHDEGVAFANRLKESDIPITLNETKNTMHGYDIAEGSTYVKVQVEKRIEFLNSI